MVTGRLDRGSHYARDTYRATWEEADLSGPRRHVRLDLLQRFPRGFLCTHLDRGSDHGRAGRPLVCLGCTLPLRRYAQSRGSTCLPVDSGSLENALPDLEMQIWAASPLQLRIGTGMRISARPDLLASPTTLCLKRLCLRPLCALAAICCRVNSSAGSQGCSPLFDFRRAAHILR